MPSARHHRAVGVVIALVVLLPEMLAAVAQRET